MHCTYWFEYKNLLFK